MVKQLLKKGADVDIKDEKGYTALAHAVKNDHTDVAKLLLDYSASIHWTNKEGESLIAVAKMKGCAETIKLCLLYGATPSDKLMIQQALIQIKNTEKIVDAFEKYKLLNFNYSDRPDLHFFPKEIWNQIYTFFINAMAFDNSAVFQIISELNQGSGWKLHRDAAEYRKREQLRWLQEQKQIRAKRAQYEDKNNCSVQ